MYTSHRSWLGTVMCFSTAGLNSCVGLYTLYAHYVGLPLHLWRVFNVRNTMLVGGPNGVGCEEVKEASRLFRPAFRSIRSIRMNLQLSNVSASCLAISLRFQIRTETHTVLCNSVSEVCILRYLSLLNCRFVNVNRLFGKVSLRS
jgi:hypothetical protein